MKLDAGQIVHVKGIPVELKESVEVFTADGNWAMIQQSEPEIAMTAGGPEQSSQQ